MATTDRPSSPLLKMLRDWIKKKGLNTAAAANAMGVERARARHILSGTEAMTVDELLKLGNLLDLSPEDLAFGAEPAPKPSTVTPLRSVSATGAAVLPPDEPDLVIDPYGNQPEQLFQTAFALGCDFMFVVAVDELGDSGVPASVLKQYQGRELPIKLDAAFHQYNDPQFSDAGVSITLSFDALYTCTFPWSAFRQFIFFPLPPDPAEEEEEEAVPSDGGRPVLRLVT